MTLTPGMRLGPYEILAAIGAGGMGEVYRAKDTRLNRDVALKILPDAFAADPDRRARFSREAQLLASLNHPNIAGIYGVEDSGDSHALAMEFVDGEDLSAIIARGRMPLAEGLLVAKQIVAALEAAHEQGIIHRDLKPQNIKVTPDGTVKVLDFGLAKAIDAAPVSGGDLTNSPTRTARATAMGMILGTTAYMSPEQARGRPVDKRTDVWALGCVLYEMLSGARAFEGDDATEVISSVMKSEPDWNALPADLPPHMRSIVMRCLVKDRKDRVPDVSVVRFALDGTLSASNPVPAAPATAPRWSRILPWAVTALTVAISIWSLWKRASSEPTPVVYAAIDAPDGFVLGEDAGSFGGLPSRTPILFTPDGRGLIVLATRPVEPGAKIPEGGRSRLFFRSLDRPDLRLIAGTEGARTPFVSPDGKWIGFWASNELRKVPIDGGAPRTICPLVTAFLGPFGAAWGPDDTIVFGDVASGRIMRVTANGGTPIAVTTPPSVASRRRHIAPVFLPDGKRILFTDTSTQDAADARIMQQPLEGGAATLVIDKAADGRLLASGQLAFIRLATLMTVPFDSGRAMVQGEPAAVMNNVMQGAMIRLGAVTHPGMAMFAVSSQGTLAALRGGLASVPENLLLWTDPRGVSSAEPAQGAPKGARMNTRIAPDRSRALVTVFTPRRREMWLADWTRNVWNACESCDTDLGAAEWSPDGRRLLLGRDGTLLDHALDGSAPDRVLVREPDRSVLPVAWLADGRIVYMSSPNLAEYDLRLLAPGGTSGQVVMPLGFGLDPDISPDGRWLAYNPWTGSGSAATLRDVVVQAFPGPGARLQVSAGGGYSAFWSKDSKTVYFVNLAKELLAVNISLSGGLSATSPKVVLSHVEMCGPVRCADLSEGQRVLTTTELVKPPPVTRIDLVLNWASTLGRK